MDVHLELVVPEYCRLLLCVSLMTVPISFINTCTCLQKIKIIKPQKTLAQTSLCSQWKFLRLERLNYVKVQRQGVSNFIRYIWPILSFNSLCMF